MYYTLFGRIKLGAHVATSSGYVGTAVGVQHLPVFGGGVLCVGGEDDSVIWG